MKTQLVNLWKNVVEIVSEAFDFGDTLLSIIVLLIVTTIAICVVSIVSNFMADHQWVILLFDATCIVLLTMAIRIRLDKSLQTSKGIWIFWLLFSNVLILVVSSFGVLWNFLIILFVLWPIAIGFSRFNLKDLLSAITMEWALSISSIGMSLCVLLAVLDSHIIYIVIQCLLIATMLFVWIIAVRNKRRQKIEI